VGCQDAVIRLSENRSVESRNGKLGEWDQTWDRLEAYPAIVDRLEAYPAIVDRLEAYPTIVDRLEAYSTLSGLGHFSRSG
jgi:hypothetical protein